MSDQTKHKSFGSGLKTLFNGLVLMSTGGIMLTLLVAGVGMWRMGDRFFTAVENLFKPTIQPPQVDVRSIVINQIRGVSELTTAIFVMEAVVPAKQDLKLGDLTVGTTKLIYLAHGEVRAGIDLSLLTEKDVEVNQAAQTIFIHLPPPRILDSKIDVDRSGIYDYDRGFLGMGPDTGPSLQLFAQQHTLKKIVTAACDNGVLDKANERAEIAISKLVNLLENKKITVVTQPTTPAACAQTFAVTR